MEKKEDFGPGRVDISEYITFRNELFKEDPALQKMWEARQKLEHERKKPCTEPKVPKP
jgi:hypothetical protein